jgi:hypothetical protein
MSASGASERAVPQAQSASDDFESVPRRICSQFAGWTVLDTRHAIYLGPDGDHREAVKPERFRSTISPALGKTRVAPDANGLTDGHSDQRQTRRPCNKGADDVTDPTTAAAARTSNESVAAQPHQAMAVFAPEQRALPSVTPEGVLPVGGTQPDAELAERLGPGERRRCCRQPSATAARCLSLPRHWVPALRRRVAGKLSHSHGRAWPSRRRSGCDQSAAA